MKHSIVIVTFARVVDDSGQYIAQQYKVRHKETEENVRVTRYVEF